MSVSIPASPSTVAWTVAVGPAGGFGLPIGVVVGAGAYGQVHLSAQESLSLTASGLTAGTQYSAVAITSVYPAGQAPPPVLSSTTALDISAGSVTISGTVDATISSGTVDITGPVDVQNYTGTSLSTTRGSALLGHGTSATSLNLSLAVDSTVRGITLVMLMTPASDWSSGAAVAVGMHGATSGLYYVGSSSSNPGVFDLPQEGLLVTFPVVGALDSTIDLTVTNDSGIGSIETWAFAEYDPIAVVASQATDPVLGTPDPFVVAGQASGTTFVYPLNVDGNGCLVLPTATGGATQSVGISATATLALPGPPPILRGISWNYTGTPTGAGFLFIKDGTTGDTLWQLRLIASVAYNVAGTVPLGAGGYQPGLDLTIGGNASGGSGELCVTVIY